MSTRLGRRFWTQLVREAERGQRSHAEVAARHGVLVSTLRSWIYRLRREQREARGPRSRAPEVQLLPVEIAPSLEVSRATIELRVASGDVIVFEPGVDVAYIGALVSALRGGAC